MAMSKLKGLQQWCKLRVDGYRDVEVTNMSSSFKSGLAFCAIIHRFRPDLIDYDSLRKEDCFENNDLAFTVAERELGIPALLDADDMVAMRVPDKLCVITYVAQYHNYFKDKPQLGGPGVQKSTSKSASIKRPSQPPESAPAAKVANVEEKKLSRVTSMGDICFICKKKVFVLERQIEGHKLYHRSCFRTSEMSPTNKIYARPSDLGIKPSVEKMEVDREPVTPKTRGNAVRDMLADKTNDKQIVNDSPRFSKQQDISNVDSKFTKNTEKLKAPNAEESGDLSDVMRRIRPTPVVRPAGDTTSAICDTKTDARPKPVKRRSQEAMINDCNTERNTPRTPVVDSSGRNTTKTPVIDNKPFNSRKPAVATDKFQVNDVKSQTPRATDVAKANFLARDEDKTVPNVSAVKVRQSKVPETNADKDMKSGLLKSLANVRPRKSCDLDAILAANEKIESQAKRPQKPVTPPQKDTEPPEWQNIALKKSNDRKVSKEDPDKIKHNDRISSANVPLNQPDTITLPPRPKFTAKKDIKNSENLSVVNKKNTDNSGDRVSTPLRPKTGAKDVNTRRTLNDATTHEVHTTEDKIVLPPRPKITAKVDNKWPRKVSDETTTNKLNETEKSEDKVVTPQRPKIGARVVQASTDKSDTADKKGTRPSSTTPYKPMFPKPATAGKESTEKPVLKPVSKPVSTAKEATEKPGKVLLPPRPKVVNVPVNTDSTPDWQIEAKKRADARGGKYVDPEKVTPPTRGDKSVDQEKPAVNNLNTPKVPSKYDDNEKTTPKASSPRASSPKASSPKASSPKASSPRGPIRPPRTFEYGRPSIPKTDGTSNGYVKQTGKGEYNGPSRVGKGDRTESPPQPTSRVRERSKSEDRLDVPKRTPLIIHPSNHEVVDHKAIDDTTTKPGPNRPARITVKDDTPPRKSSAPVIISTSPTNKRPKRPAPGRPPPPRRSIGQNRMSATDIQKQLNIIDDKLTRLEHRGRDLEDAIRKAIDELAVDEEDSLHRTYEAIAVNLPGVKRSSTLDFFGSVDVVDGVDDSHTLDNVDGVQREDGVRVEDGVCVEDGVLDGVDDTFDIVDGAEVLCDQTEPHKDEHNPESHRSSVFYVVLDDGTDGFSANITGEDDDDKLMIDWFKLVNEKNALVRDEADIIYQAREQDLEDQQIDIDHKLRLILNKPHHEKNEEDLREEEYLLKELLKVVGQRDRIVDSIDEDKHRYEEEDADIWKMMRHRGYVDTLPR